MEDNQLAVKAARAGKWGHVRQLLEIQDFKNVNLKDNCERTILHWATAEEPDNVEMVSFLLANKADVNAKDDAGDTPLHCCVGSDEMDNPCVVEIARLLLADKRTNINSTNHDGYTPLHAAVNCWHNVILVKLLLDSGASINKENEYGSTPLDKACKRGNVAAACALLNKGAKFAHDKTWPDDDDDEVKIETLKEALEMQCSMFQESLVTAVTHSL